MGITACGFQEVFLTFVLWHFCRSIWVQVAVTPSQALHTNFYFKWVLCVFKCDDIKACHQPRETGNGLFLHSNCENWVFSVLGGVFECLNWSNPADITSASQLKWHLRNVYDNIYFSCLIFLCVLFSFEFYLTQKTVLLILVIPYDIRISL